MEEVHWEMVAGIIGILTFIGAIATAFVGYGRLKSRAEEAVRTANEAKEKAERNSTDFSAFRERAAREFVSLSMLEKVEERVIGAIDRLADRLDRLFENSKD